MLSIATSTSIDTSSVTELMARSIEGIFILMRRSRGSSSLSISWDTVSMVRMSVESTVIFKGRLIEGVEEC